MIEFLQKQQQQIVCPVRLKNNFEFFKASFFEREALLSELRSKGRRRLRMVLYFFMINLEA